MISVLVRRTYFVLRGFRAGWLLTRHDAVRICLAAVVVAAPVRNGNDYRFGTQTAWLRKVLSGATFIDCKLCATQKGLDMKLSTLRDLLVEEVRDLYSAESQLVKALPRMAKAASSEALSDAITAHLEETKGQIERLDQVFELLGAAPGRKKCKAMEGLITEGKEVIAEDADPAVHDAALIASAQRVEHYEIAGYGCARTFARILGEDDVAELLQQTLDEEAAADEKLTSIAMSGINQTAAAMAE